MFRALVVAIVVLCFCVAAAAQTTLYMDIGQDSSRKGMHVIAHYSWGDDAFVIRGWAVDETEGVYRTVMQLNSKILAHCPSADCVVMVHRISMVNGENNLYFTAYSKKGTRTQKRVLLTKPPKPF